MKIETYGVRMKIGPQLENRITKKLEKFSRYFNDDALAQVKCSKDGPNRIRVEITLYVKKHIYRAERNANDAFTALDLAIGVLEGQIRKNKTKFLKRINEYAYIKEYLKNEILEEEIDDSDEVLANGDEETLQNATYRFKTFELRPMTKEEATLQMEMLGHAFFLFLDDESNNVNLLYKRKDGNYGVIIPDYAK